MAQRFGFEGGLVPGVTVSAYLVQPGVEVWGDAFFAGGGAHVQILKPTYHDEPFRCEITVQTDAHFESQIVNSTGRVNAVATVTRHVEEQRQPLPIFRGDPLASPDYLAPNATPERFEALKEKGCLATEYLFDAANPRTWYFHTASQMPRTHHQAVRCRGSGAYLFFVGMRELDFLCQCEDEPLGAFRDPSSIDRAHSPGRNGAL